MNLTSLNPRDALDRLDELCRRMSYREVAELAQIGKALETGFAGALRQLASRKQRRAIWENRSYIRPEVTAEMLAVAAVANGLNFSRPRRGKR